MSHCYFCETDFASGRPCRTEEQRDKCSEWAAAKMAECDYWNGRESLGETSSIPRPQGETP